jgi:cell division septal protein FtsQ
MIGEYGKSTVRQRKINRRVALRRVMLALIVLCVAAIGIRAGAGFDSFVLFPVGRVEVYGNGFVTKTEVLRLIGLDANRSILTFRRGRARKRLLADKRVQGAEIVKLLPDTLRVYVVGRHTGCRRTASFWERPFSPGPPPSAAGRSLHSNRILSILK